MERSFSSNPVNSLASYCTFDAVYHQQQKQISIVLHQPSYKTRIVKMNPMCSISILNKVYQQGSIFISNGVILDSDKSFIDYDITDEAIITIVSPKMANLKKNIIEKIIEMTKDDNFQQKIMIQTNKNNRQELFRIRDIRLMKKENKRKFYKRYALYEDYYKKIFEMNVKNDNQYNETNLTTENEANEPSCEPLPILW